MNRGIYPLLSGGIAQEMKLEMISNNLSNINTIGYKKDKAIFKSYLPSYNEPYPDGGSFFGKDKAFVQYDRSVIDLSGGPIKNTGNKLDLAINGDGFFAIEKDGGTRYTRNGNFSLDDQRRIVTQDGDPVLGEGGPIQLPEGEITVDEKGTVYAGNQEAGMLRIVTFANQDNLEKEGESLLSGGAEQPSEKFSVVQGALEQSNVNTIEEMASMIEVLRGYESYQKAIQTIDEINSRSVTEIGRV
ncbi:MAG: flagellar basal-body rod protein FlgF [Nitrospirae bacterium]|nr:flagellar basal-body rod protein FlgF [Nitrospirota bacterium]